MIWSYSDHVRLKPAKFASNFKLLYLWYFPTNSDAVFTRLEKDEIGLGLLTRLCINGDSSVRSRRIQWHVDVDGHLCCIQRKTPSDVVD